MISDEISFFLRTDPDFKSLPQVAETDSLVDAGVLDSFSIVKLVIFLERKFNIKIELSDLDEENIASVKSIEKMVMEKLKKKT